jgi:hypothetical protein
MKPALEHPKTGAVALDRFCSNVKQILDDITGQSRKLKRLQPLPADATLPQVIERLNEVLSRLQ